MFLLFLLFSFASAWFYGRDAPDRWSVGEVFPIPEAISYGKTNRSLDPKRVRFIVDPDCDILADNAERYINRWMFPFPVDAKHDETEYYIAVLVDEQCPDGPPPHNASEEYSLRIWQNHGVIEAKTVWGAIRAMETASQLIFYDEKEQKYFIRTAKVVDKPRFPIRGVLLDSSRHFLSKKVIKRQLDIMAMHKMNFLHWHLVDSEAFPYESKKFPQLHSIGAYSPRHFYSQEDVKEIISYARLRGIRVVPEFDLPGHTGSWKGQKGFLASCYDEKGQETWQNLLDPSEEANFEFIEEFLTEVTDTFPDEFLHLGGDEVEAFLVECWDRNPKIQEFKKQKGFSNNTQLENYFLRRLEDIVGKLEKKRRIIQWQEVFENSGEKLEKKSIVHIWKGPTFSNDTHEEIMEKVKEVTEKGHGVIVSACWYLDYIASGAEWRDLLSGRPANSQYYYCDPTNFTGTDEQKALVLGGIVALWGEFVDNTNLEARLWPRASSAAERLWSPAMKTKDASVAWPRMHEFRCRLVARGYRIQPTNYPDYCPFEFEQ